MPTVSVRKDKLFERLGFDIETYTDEQFDHLCFEFGVELDDVTTNLNETKVQKGEEAAAAIEEDYVIYKIDVPANRYDLLCLEGIALALQVFLKQRPPPVYSVTPPTMQMNVKAATKSIRPYVVCAVLRNVSLDQLSYKSFIDLQDKLHFNICRRRTLVAIGTHDLDSIEAPFSYEAKTPKDIRFVPLSQTKEFDAEELMTYYLTDPKVKHIKPYVSIIHSSPVYPIIYDSKQRVLSLPPIINSEHSKISIDTKNIFIECTATDLNKANVVLNTIVCQFSEYCKKPFQVEQVKVVYDSGDSYVTPILDNFIMPSKLKYLNDMSGLSLKVEDICNLATKMMLAAEYDATNDVILTRVPPTRSDILHPCDIAEDIAIAYGYNNLKKRPLKYYSVGKQQPLNHLTEILRHEIAGARFTEVLTLGLCSRKENYADLRLADDGKSVALSNPKTKEFEVCRTSLIPGILKTARENKSLKLKNGIRLFEISDVVIKDNTNPVGARNRRYLAALNMGLEGAGFENVQGLLDRVMELLAVDPTETYHSFGPERCWLKRSVDQYELKHGDCPTYLQCADIVVYVGAERKEQIVGRLGIVHPEVLKNFDIENPCSLLEMDIEFFLNNKYSRRPEEPSQPTESKDD